MQDRQASRTAQFSAIYRAYHARYDHPQIFDDPLAESLVGEEEIQSFYNDLLKRIREVKPAWAEKYPADADLLARLMQSMAAAAGALARARYAEDCLRQAVSEGVQQYVILGAGLDTYAFREKNQLDRLKVVEIDHPATQAYKRKRLAELGWEIPRQLHFVPVDFTRQNLQSALTDSDAFDPAQPTFFSWLGVAYFLPPEAVETTLGCLAGIAPAGCQVVFDYLEPAAYIRDQVSPRVKSMMKSAALEGEPIESAIPPGEVKDYVARLGLALRENLGPAELQRRYFQNRTDGYYACEHIHLVWAKGNSDQGASPHV